MATSALTQLLKLSQPQDPHLNPAWVPQLSDYFAASGLTVLDSDIREMLPALGFAMHECALQIHDLIAEMTTNEEVAPGLKELMPQVLKEAQQGACWAFTRWTVVGNKPVA